MIAFGFPLQMYWVNEHLLNEGCLQFVVTYLHLERYTDLWDIVH